MLSLHGFVWGPAHISNLSYLQHFLIVDLYLIKFVSISTIYCVGGRAIVLSGGVEMCGVCHCRGLVSCVGFVVISWEDLGEGISYLDASIETYTLIYGTIESHKESWIVVVMLGNWGVVEVMEACLYRLEGSARRIEHVFSVFQTESLCLT